MGEYFKGNFGIFTEWVLTPGNFAQLALALPRIMSNAYVESWDMLNNFCFHVYAQMSLFVKMAMLFLQHLPFIELVPS